jgi:hypothetical protein
MGAWKAVREGKLKGLQGAYVPLVDCVLSSKHQWSVRNIFVTHLEVWGPGRSGEAEGEAEGSTWRICAGRGLWVAP